MSSDFKRVAIIGLGLLGGSVGLALQKRGGATRVVASSRSQEPLERALAEGMVDEIGDIASSVRGADLLVLATPVGTMSSVVREAVPHMSPGLLVTDVGSIKGPLADTLPGLLPQKVVYVGAHPMAGGHEQGSRYSRADLFVGSPCVISGGTSAPPEAVERVAGFWASLGADVLFRDPVRHDQEVAWVSHVPHAVAFAYAEALTAAPSSAMQLAGSGFRDFTRIARSDPELWSEILNSNRKAVGSVLQTVGRSLVELGSLIEAGDVRAQEDFLSRGRAALASVSTPPVKSSSRRINASVQSGEINPEIQVDPESAVSRSNEATHE